MKMGEVAGMVFEAGMAAYRADRRKRYSLLKPWTLPLLELELPAYDGPLIRVEPVGKRSRVTVKPYSGEVCDGASFAPDWPTGAIPAALFHDPWYLEVAAIAEAWGLDEDAVRVIGDGILSTIMLRAGGRRWVARVYYNAVFRLGGLFRRLSKRGGGDAGGGGGDAGGAGGEVGGIRGAGVTDRAAETARHAGPSAALSRDDATTRLASPAPSCGQTSLTHGSAAEKPVRDPGGHRGGYAASVWRVVLVVGVLIGMGGCSGCLAPVDWSDPKEPYTPPEWEEAGANPSAKRPASARVTLWEDSR